VGGSAEATSNHSETQGNEFELGPSRPDRGSFVKKETHGGVKGEDPNGPIT